MSPTALSWIRALHLYGVFLWLGPMIALAHTLAAHARAEPAARPAFHGLERATAIAMDIGATLGIVLGVILFVKLPGMTSAGYLHAKLALVVLGLLGAHGYLRAKVRRFREGKVAPIPGFIPPLLSILALAIIVLVVVKPF
jgi:uncharacterized membrane protein